MMMPQTSKKKVQRKSVLHLGSKVYGAIGTKSNDPFNGEVSEQLEPSILPKSQVSEWFCSQKIRGDIYVVCVRLVQKLSQPSALPSPSSFPVLNSRLRVETERKLGDFTLEQLVLVARLESSQFFGESKLKKQNRESFLIIKEDSKKK